MDICYASAEYKMNLQLSTIENARNYLQQLHRQNLPNMTDEGQGETISKSNLT